MEKRKACVELPLASELAGNVGREKDGMEGLAYHLLPVISGVGKLEPLMGPKTVEPMGVTEQGGGKSKGK